MPNWCEDELVVRGPKSERDRLKRQVRGTQKEEATGEPKGPAEILVETLADENEMQDLDFGKIVPMPPELMGTTSPTQEGEEARAKELIKKYGAANWYDWHVKYWGCKWNASEPSVYDEGDKLTYVFQTPWGPPLPVVQALGEQFPKLEFTLKFWEAGMGFRGILKVKGKKVINFKEYDYHGGRGG